MARELTRLKPGKQSRHRTERQPPLALVSMVRLTTAIDNAFR